jgi:hypothetical protein
VFDYVTRPGTRMRASGGDDSGVATEADRNSRRTAYPLSVTILREGPHRSRQPTDHPGTGTFEQPDSRVGAPSPRGATVAPPARSTYDAAADARRLKAKLGL